jgi:hypothetical protein
MAKEAQRFLIKCFWMKNWGSKKIHQELVTKLRADVYGRTKIKIWLEKSRKGQLSCQDVPRTERPPLTLGP